MIIKVLGTGCAKCKLLEQVTRDVVDQLGLDAQIVKVDKMEDIMQYDILATPALVADETVILSGRIPQVEELKSLLH